MPGGHWDETIFVKNMNLNTCAKEGLKAGLTRPWRSSGGQLWFFPSHYYDPITYVQFGHWFLSAIIFLLIRNLYLNKTSFIKVSNSSKTKLKKKAIHRCIFCQLCHHLLSEITIWRFQFGFSLGFRTQKNTQTFISCSFVFS